MWLRTLIALILSGANLLRLASRLVNFCFSSVSSCCTLLTSPLVFWAWVCNADIWSCETHQLFSPFVFPNQSWFEHALCMLLLCMLLLCWRSLLLLHIKAQIFFFYYRSVSQPETVSSSVFFNTWTKLTRRAVLDKTNLGTLWGSLRTGVCRNSSGS